MKSKYLLLILTIVLVMGMLGIPTAHGAYTLVWSDEFDRIDTGKWVFETGNNGGWGNGELEYYQAANATCSGGILTIAAKKESVGGCSYTSARMKTAGKFSFTYGRVEARLLVPKGQGLWPAFWMLGNNINSGTVWPACGEIDIMEHVNTDDNCVGTIHWDYNGHAYYGGTKAVSNMATWHTYSIEWTSSYIRWFVDGAQYWEANILNNINGTEEFHRPFFILLNLAVGGQWPGSPNSTTPFPAYYQVDYVRVYQDNGGSSPTPTPPPPSNGVTFYQDANYGGTAKTLGAGSYNLSQLNAAGIPNDWMSSLKVPSGYTVVVYQNDNFGGTSWTFTADTSYVGSACNDQMSSCTITTGGSGSGYTSGVSNVSSTQAKFWFKPSGWTASYVILHYTMSGSGQQNVNMTYNSSTAQWEYTAGGLVSGRSITYNFTYNKSGTQYDTGNATWTKP